jgi:hypothetical protein
MLLRVVSEVVLVDSLMWRYGRPYLSMHAGWTAEQARSFHRTRHWIRSLPLAVGVLL